MNLSKLILISPVHQKAIMRAKRQTTEWAKMFGTHITIKGSISKVYKELSEVKKNSKNNGQ